MMPVALRARQSARKALGLPWYGGRPSGAWKRLRTDEKARVMAVVDALIELLPSGPVDRPVEEWSHAELLSDGTRKALIGHRQVVDWPLIDPNSADCRLNAADATKRNNSILGAGATLIRTFKEVQIVEFQAKTQDKGWDELLARLAQNQKKAKKTAE